MREFNFGAWVTVNMLAMQLHFNSVFLSGISFTLKYIPNKVEFVSVECADICWLKTATSKLHRNSMSLFRRRLIEILQGVRKKVSSLNMSLSRKFLCVFFYNRSMIKKINFLYNSHNKKIFKVVFIKVIDKTGLTTINMTKQRGMRIYKFSEIHKKNFLLIDLVRLNTFFTDTQYK